MRRESDIYPHGVCPHLTFRLIRVEVKICNQWLDTGETKPTPTASFHAQKSGYDRRRRLACSGEDQSSCTCRHGVFLHLRIFPFARPFLQPPSICQRSLRIAEGGHSRRERRGKHGDQTTNTQPNWATSCSVSSLKSFLEVSERQPKP